MGKSDNFGFWMMVFSWAFMTGMYITTTSTRPEIKKADFNKAKDKMENVKTTFDQMYIENDTLVLTPKAFSEMYNAINEIHSKMNEIKSSEKTADSLNVELNRAKRQMEQGKPR